MSEKRHLYEELPQKSLCMPLGRRVPSPQLLIRRSRLLKANL
jgi:hypothetical protein